MPFSLLRFALGPGFGSHSFPIGLGSHNEFPPGFVVVDFHRSKRFIVSPGKNLTGSAFSAATMDCARSHCRADVALTGFTVVSD